MQAPKVGTCFQGKDAIMISQPKLYVYDGNKDR